MDGAQQLKVTCVGQSDGQREDAVLAKTSVQVRGRVSPFTCCLLDARVASKVLSFSWTLKPFTSNGGDKLSALAR